MTEKTRAELIDDIDDIVPGVDPDTYDETVRLSRDDKAAILDYIVEQVDP